MVVITTVAIDLDAESEYAESQLAESEHAVTYEDAIIDLYTDAY